MSYRILLLIGVVAFSCTAGAPDTSIAQQSFTSGQQIPLWPEGAADSLDRKSEPEDVRERWVRNVHDPSVTVYLPPKGKSNGTAVVIFPGGGHRKLVMKTEGYEPARYFNDLGVTAVVLKYRLAREENSPYKIEVHPKRDAQRAIRWTRVHAQDLKIDTEKIGIVGFSAGGEVASLVAYSDFQGLPGAVDPIDRASCHANFQVLVYPGPQGMPQIVPTGAPPTFIVAANDDRLSQCAIELMQRFRRSDVPIEFHLYAKGGHGFYIGKKSKLKSISHWPGRLTDWLQDSQFIE